MTDEEVLHQVVMHPRGTAAHLAALLGVSRQASSARLRLAVQAGWLRRDGTGAGVKYAPNWPQDAVRQYATAGLEEDRVWDEFLAPLVRDLPANVRDIWHYGFTEMINNAVDHSQSARIEVGLRRNALCAEGWVKDGGVGIFHKIQQALGLLDPRESLLELAKGKFTTDPQRHSGEGIFFSSKVFDAFQIESGALIFRHDDGESDVLLDDPCVVAGTCVQMRLAHRSTRTLRAVFDRFAAPDEYSFAATLVPVRLAQHEGSMLVSRSQARRLTQRFEKFREVMLDFNGVHDIGQAFADEVFRVFANAHPHTRLTPIHMNDAVTKMVRRARSHAA